MIRPWLGYNSKADCEGGWEFYSRDDKVLPLETVNAYIKSVNGEDILIPREYLRLHPEILKDAGAGGTSITKAVEGVGGALPPRPEPEQRPFAPPASPYSQPPPRDPNLDRREGFDPTRRPPAKEKS